MDYDAARYLAEHLALELRDSFPEQPSLRDQFAMSCPITIEWFTENRCNTKPTLREYCEFRYEYADFMMKVRGEK